MKKKISTLILAGLLAFSLIGTVSATTISDVAVKRVSNDASEIALRAEQTKWYYRTTPDGTRQKRLWSITEAEWLTEWMDVSL